MNPAPPAPRMPGDFLPYGAVYILNQEFSTEQVRRDIGRIAEVGLNAVMLWPAIEWDIAARAPDWSRIDVALAAIEAAGLRCVPELIGEVHWMEFAPSFRTAGRRDIWSVPSRLTAASRFGEEGPNLNHPFVRELIDEFCRHVAARYTQSPSLYAYNIWDEPFFASEDEHTLAAFREWLRAKYGSLDSLNRLYGRTWADWREVAPTTFGWFSNMPRIDWELFRLHNTNQILRFLVETMRKYDPATPILTHPVGEQLHKPGRPMMDGWGAAKAVEIYGLSFYHKDEGRPADDAPWHHASVFDAVRCAAGQRPAILAECQSNHRCETSLFGYMDGPEVELLSWQSFAHGCKGVLFWKWLPFLHGGQNLGRGLCLTDGTPTERALAAGKVGRALAAHRDLFAAAQPWPAEAGILFSPADEAKGRLLTPPGLDETKRAGGAWLADHHRRSCTGVYRALWARNIPADYLNCDYLDAEKLAGYRVLFAPFLRMVAPPLAAMLADWIRAGGTLVADARFAVSDLHDLSYPTSPTPPLSDCLGGTRTEYTASASPYPLRCTPAAPWAGDAPVAGMYFHESWRLAEDVEILAEFPDATPAAFRHAAGQGTAIAAATCLFAAVHGDQPDGIERLIVGLVEQAGVRPPVQVAAPPGRVSARLARSGDRTLVFLLNLTDEPQDADVALPPALAAKPPTWIVGDAGPLPPRGVRVGVV